MAIDWKKAASTTGDIAGTLSGVGAIGSGISAIGSMLGLGDSAKKQAEQQMAMQKELIDYNYAKQLEQWNRENVYNSPQSQLERLKQAGLNPLFRDLDGNSAGGLSSVNAPAAPSLAEINNSVAATQKMNMERITQLAQLRSVNAQAEKDRIEAKWYDKFQELHYNKEVAEMNKTEKETGKIQKETDLLDKEIDKRQQDIDRGEIVLAFDKAKKEYYLTRRTFVDENGETYEMTPLDKQMQTELDTATATLNDINEMIIEHRYTNNRLRILSKTWEKEAQHIINMMNLTEQEKAAVIGMTRALMNNYVIEGKTMSFNLGQLEKWSDKFNTQKFVGNARQNFILKKEGIRVNENNRAIPWLNDQHRWNSYGSHYGALSGEYGFANQELNGFKDDINVFGISVGVLGKAMGVSSKLGSVGDSPNAPSVPNLKGSASSYTPGPSPDAF